MGWKPPEHGKFTSLHPASCLYLCTPSLPPPFLLRTPRVSRARTRAKLRGNGCLCDRGGWAVRSERRATWVCNVRHVGHGALNRGGTAEYKKKETDRERPRPGPARLCSRCYGPKPTDWLQETATDSSMRTRGRPAVIPSRSNRFMLHLLI